MHSILSSLERALRPRGHVFYGWWLVLATGGIHLLSSVLWMQSYGAYVVLLQEEFGWSKTLIATGHACALLAVSTMMVHLISHLTPSHVGFTLAARPPALPRAGG